MNELEQQVYIQHYNEVTFPCPEVKSHAELRHAITARDAPVYMKKTERGEKNIAQSCIICLDAGANAVLMDCGHGAICFKCGLVLLETTCECHLCRQPVIQVLRIDTAFESSDLLKVLESVDLHSINKYTKDKIPEIHNI